MAGRGRERERKGGGQSGSWTRRRRAGQEGQEKRSRASGDKVSIWPPDGPLSQRAAMCLGASGLQARGSQRPPGGGEGGGWPPPPARPPQRARPHTCVCAQSMVRSRPRGVSKACEPRVAPPKNHILPPRLFANRTPKKKSSSPNRQPGEHPAPRPRRVRTPLQTAPPHTSRKLAPGACPRPATHNLALAEGPPAREPLATALPQDTPHSSLVQIPGPGTASSPCLPPRRENTAAHARQPEGSIVAA